MANITSHRWEFYFRASTVLGIVGARSVDFELIAPLRLFDHYQRVHDSYHDLGLCCGAGKPGRSAAEAAEVVLLHLSTEQRPLNAAWLGHWWPRVMSVCAIAS